jgi:hypothetical protein
MSQWSSSWCKGVQLSQNPLVLATFWLDAYQRLSIADWLFGTVLAAFG